MLDNGCGIKYTSYMATTKRTKAPVDAVDAAISRLSTRIAELCQAQAVSPTQARQDDINAAVAEKILRQFERSEIITKYFNS